MLSWVISNAIGNFDGVSAASSREKKNYRSQDILHALTRHNLLLPLDILLLGATGVGKSSTLNAIFGNNVAKVGDGVDPETQSISDYRVHDYLRIHDSAGLGDGREADVLHMDALARTLQWRCNGEQSHYGVIDLALVIMDGGSRDLGTTYQLLESVVLKHIAPERVVLAINQADMAMKGRHWNRVLGSPEPELAVFLAEKAVSVQERILMSTGLFVEQPVCYSASYEWNIDALIDHIIAHIPNNRRIL